MLRRDVQAVIRGARTVFPFRKARNVGPEIMGQSAHPGGHVLGEIPFHGRGIHCEDHDPSKDQLAPAKAPARRSTIKLMLPPCAPSNAGVGLPSHVL